jgi:hypothetical protein
VDSQTAIPPPKSALGTMVVLLLAQPAMTNVVASPRARRTLRVVAHEPGQSSGTGTAGAYYATPTRRAGAALT